MRKHRSAPLRSCTPLPDRLLQDRTLSYTARGLLADLLSRPDRWREDGRQMADSSPQGRAAIRKALKELTQAGYYWVVKTRLPDGTFRSEIHVFDTPQAAPPGVIPPGPGGAAPGPPVTQKTENRGEQPTRPVLPVPEAIREAVATLYRVIRPEPRLRLRESQAHALAPLVARWLELGSTAADLARALLDDLPATVTAPAGLLRNRLERKMPQAAVRGAVREVRSAAPLPECARCHDPVAGPGFCRACTGRSRPGGMLTIGGGAEFTPAGAARAREAMRAAKSQLRTA
ncbi:hypothetical protein OG455_16045 [Kitasatospora sp. NBC_01287]|uniref:hypothetical protein n=1 Tax=Kitasatospora sp. NBC_01287 TaxID=2903573 RepID=UPI0022549B78|nr:hypothetical protein [Kitasatospora sp. NBC_01287]MCX4747020.1 hypothetical protein [Kitasatospora sp. NBC_01287]